MPRIVVTSNIQMEEFMDRFVTPQSHTAYLTAQNEVVLEPLRSTAPLRYLYYKLLGSMGGSPKSRTEQLKQIKRVLQARGLTVLHCDRYEFVTDRPVGTTVRQYEEA